MQWLSTSCMVCLSSETRTYDVRVGNRGKDRQGKRKHIFVSGEWHREHSALSSLIDLSLVEGGGMSFPQKQKARRLAVHRRPAQLSLRSGAGEAWFVLRWKLGRASCVGCFRILSPSLWSTYPFGPRPPPTSLLPLPLQKKLMSKTTRSNILSVTLCWNREEQAGQPLQDTWVMRLCTVSNRQPHKINTKRNDKKISALIG